MKGFRDLAYSAVVLDLDGVITTTRDLHVEAWKKTFDEFLTQGASLRSFDPLTDYVNYVDGKPREDGIRSFLASRGISASEKLIRNLGVRKNKNYLDLIEKKGVHVFKDALAALKAWKRKGIPLAVVSSSRNCLQILRKAGIESFFEVRVDGVIGKRLRLRGKPNPDYFLEAAKRLKVDPAHAFMVEDSVAGVEAGRRGRFGSVIGIDRVGKNAKALLEHGADQVVFSLTVICKDT